MASPSSKPPRAEGEPQRITYSEKFACPVSGFTIAEIEPRLFSFNAPFGACPACDGLGMELFFDERLVVPDQNLTLLQGAHCALGQVEIALPHPNDGGAGPSTMALTRRPNGATCPKR
jgi:excinuclease UvrABC ATPase subunit